MLDWCIRQDNVHRFVDGKFRTDLLQTEQTTDFRGTTLWPSCFHRGDARLATLFITTVSLLGDISKHTTLGRSNCNVKNALTTARFRPSNTISCCYFPSIYVLRLMLWNLDHASPKFSSHNEGERAGKLDVNRQMLGCIHGRIKQLAKRAPTVFEHKLLEI